MRKSRNPRWAVAALLLAAAGCGEEDEDLPSYTVTAAGYRITVPGTTAGHDPATIGALLDERVEQWVASHPEQDPNRLRGVAHEYQFIVLDGWKFASPYSPTGYASGEIWTTGELHVKLALYANAGAETQGSLAGALPATAHELNHAIGIHHQ